MSMVTSYYKYIPIRHRSFHQDIKKASAVNSFFISVFQLSFIYEPKTVMSFPAVCNVIIATSPLEAATLVWSVQKLNVQKVDHHIVIFITQHSLNQAVEDKQQILSSKNVHPLCMTTASFLKAECCFLIYCTGLRSIEIH